MRYTVKTRLGVFVVGGFPGNKYDYRLAVFIRNIFGGVIYLSA